MPADDVRIPQSFLDMPRWWREGTGWLDGLPGTIRAICSRWQLHITGQLLHGSNAVVIPVDRGGSAFVLRLTPPGPGVADEVAALRFWDGRGTVQIVDADVDAGAMLLERLDASGAGSLLAVPALDAMAVLGGMMRRLAVPAPAHVPSTAAVVTDRMATLEEQWHRLGRPFDEALLRRAVDAGTRLGRTASTLAVDADLHSAQVLRGGREPWLAVDPVLLRGDIAFDLARVLWTRADEMRGADGVGVGVGIVGHFDAAVAAARIDRDHARDWVLFRSADYWLWGLAAGFTEDPRRCRRLMEAFAG